MQDKDTFKNIFRIQVTVSAFFCCAPPTVNMHDGAFNSQWEVYTEILKKRPKIGTV